MQIKTRDLALDTLLAMMVAVLVLTGSIGLMARFGGATTDPAFLASGAAMAVLLCGIGLLAACQGWATLRRLSALLLLALAGYALAHHGLQGSNPPWLALPTGEPRLAVPAWGLLLAVGLCFLVGASSSRRRPLWLATGASLSLAALASLAWLLSARPGMGASHFAATAPTFLLISLLFGIAMAVAGLRGAAGGLKLNRIAVLAVLGGVGISSMGWYLVVWQHEAGLHRQADYLLDNIQLNAEQVMGSRLDLMQRMADRLDVAAEIDEAMFARDVQNYLDDAPSLEAIGLLDADRRWQRGSVRDDGDWQWLSDQLRRQEVRDWLAMPYPQPRIMELPGSDRSGMALMVIAMPRRGQQLITALDIATMLQSRLRLQMSSYHAVILRDDRELLELRPPGVPDSASAFRHHLLARRHVGLPGGPDLTLEAYPGARYNPLPALLVPVAVALGGLVLGWLLAFSHGLVGLVMARSRALLAVRYRLEAQQAVQEMIVRERPLEETLATICRMLEGQLPGALCSIMLSDAEGRRLRLASAESLPELYRQAVGDIRITARAGACGSAAFLKETVICEDVATDRRWRGFHEVTREAGLRACWSSPVLASDGSILGVFATYHRQPGAPGEHELSLIDEATGLVALAVESHRVKRALSQSEQRYRSLFTYNPDAVFSLDLEGNFVTANDTCSRLTGYAIEELIGNHFDRFLLPGDLPRVQAYFEAASAGENSHYELDILDRQGQRRTLEMLNLPIMVDGRVQGVYGIGKDVTERRRQETRLRILERGVEASVNGVIIADAHQPDLPIIYANATFMAMTGYSREEVIGRNCRFLQGEDTDLDAVKAIRLALAEHREVHLTLCNYRKDGSPFWNDLYIAPVRDADGRVTHYVGVQHDISEHKAYEARLAYHASHDALTGLPNRALFEDRLAHDFALAQRQGHWLAVLFVDLDEFKPINDSLGHEVGDQLLVEVSRRMGAAMRAGDTLARLGGDEFVVLLPDLRHEEQAIQMAERLLPLIARPYRLAGHELHLTGSVGIAVSDEGMAEPRELIQQADMAMYQAKQQGRNAYQCFTHEITERVGERLALRNDLQEAIDGEHFELHYQPLFGRAGELVGVEALLRWKHPERGYISPAVFIPLAEETGQIMAISQWVLERGCRDMRVLAEKGLGSLKVSINLSPLQFNRPSFLETLRRTLKLTGLPPSQLELELTEGVLMHHTEEAIDILSALRGMQIDVSIDDFGTGFSSLSYLKRLPIGKVKIDRSFIRELASSEHDAAIVQGIISMAHHLGLAVVAEGIETLEQQGLLMQYGCDIFQGFLLSRPLPLDRLEAFLREREPA